MEMDEQPMGRVKTERPRDGGGPSAMVMVAKGVTGGEWEEDDGRISRRLREASGGGGLVDESGAISKPGEEPRNPRKTSKVYLELEFGVCGLDGAVLVVAAGGGVDDDRRFWEGKVSEAVVRSGLCFHMEWQILLATVMATVTSSRRV
nr:hypothetical protein Iba_chr06dCG5230 [Ipomoea batatas]